jgi:DNA-binding NarL/FixJ family response regulator
MMNVSKHYGTGNHPGVIMQINKQIRVRLLHAEPVVSAGLRAILGNSNLNLFLDDKSPLTELNDAVVIADYRSGIDFCKDKVCEPRHSGNRVLIVTQCAREFEVRTAVEYGVLGYLLQSCVPDELTNAVISLSNGRRYLSDHVARSLVDSMSHNELTGREADVLQLLGKGHCNKLIARELGIGAGTVKSHLKRVMSKLNVTARTQAVVVATQRGLIGAETS